jgi:phosphoribosylanthranilate isomerase
MVGQTQFCISGVMSAESARIAVDAGADYVGFEVSRTSPRYVCAETRSAWWSELPDGAARIAVVRNPGFGDLEAVAGPEFDGVMVYFPNETAFFEVAMWTDIIPPEKLWLVPEVLPGGLLDLSFLPLADHMVLNRYRPSSFAMEAKTGDWAEFARLRSMHQKVKWVLSGGLTPDNLGAALATTEARWVLFNGPSIESELGCLDAEKLGMLTVAAKKVVAA